MASYTFPNVPDTYADGDTILFNYTGSVQVFDTSKISRMKIECYGAAGGSGNGYSGGNGGYAYGELDCLNNGSKFNNTLYVLVGGKGGTGNTGGGWNGGGHAPCGCGGGASDVRSVYTSNTMFQNSSLTSRIIVAAGGGGADWSGNDKGYGGAGGGWVGSPGQKESSGGTQTAGGYGPKGNGGFGYGGGFTVQGDKCGGGGSGWYGGSCGDGAAGGSSYVSGTSPYPNPYDIKLEYGGTAANQNGSNGYILITVLTAVKQYSALYVGVDGISRLANNLYVGVGEIARKAVKAYIGVDGVARQIWPPPKKINPPVIIVASTTLKMTVGVFYGLQLQASEGDGTYIWTATGLPPGLSIYPTTGALSGYPTGGSTLYSAIITVTSAGLSTSKNFSIIVNPAAGPID